MIMETGDIAIITVQTLGAYLTLCVFGAMLTSRPRANPLIPRGQFLSTLGRLTMQIIFPCLLLATLGKNLSLEHMRSAWPMFLWGFVHQIVGLVVGLVVPKIFGLPKEFNIPFALACAYGNCGSLPLVLVETLSRQEPISNNEEAAEMLVTFVFMFVTSWCLSFWTVGIIILRWSWRNDGIDEFGNKIDVNSAVHVSALASLKSVCSKVVNPLMAAVILGLAIGLIEPLQDVFFSGTAPMRFLSSAVETLGKPSVGLSTLLMSASLGGFFDTYLKQLKARKRKASNATNDHDHDHDRVVTNEIMEMVYFDASGIAEASHPANDVTKFEISQDFGGVEHQATTTTTLPTATMTTPSTTTPPPTATPPSPPPPFSKIASDDLLDNGVCGAVVEEQEIHVVVPWKSVMVLAATRSLVLPAINMSMVFWLADDILPEWEHRGLAKLVLMLQSCVPAADTLIVVCQQFHHFEVAETLAASYLFMYIIGMIPLGVAIGVSFDNFDLGNTTAHV